MGCDIHMHIEYFDNCYKDKTKPIKKWRCADWFKLNEYYGKKGELKYKQVPLYEDRNYKLFALLADVRNDNNIEPISEPRGIPFNVSDEVLKDYNEWGDDAHSASYLTLQELTDFVNNKQGSSRDVIFHTSIYCLINLIDDIKDHVESDGFIYDCDDIELGFHTLNDVRIVFWFDN